MVSEEKMIHILHLMLDGLEKEGYAQYPSRLDTTREAKRICLGFLRQYDSAEEVARKRIKSLRNPPPEYSLQWDTLFSKYLEEELRKRG